MYKFSNINSDIVISGISGRYPNSDDVNEFWTNLVEGTDMISSNHDRYDHLTLRIPTRMGVINSLEKFDAEFFSVPPKFCDIMDPRLRKLLEVCHEAVVDAGVVPKSIQGSRTGVFVGVTDSDAGAITKRTRKRTNLYGVLGNESSMLANRVSYTMDLNGPSLSVHTACSSGFTAVHQAILAIRAGLCDAAIVAGAQCNHDAVTSFMFHGLEMTSTDGKCRSFDAGADGFVRAEAVVAIYICKMHEAKRAYATLIHAAINNDGYKEEGISFPSRVQQENVIRQVYDETGIDPLEVDYVEAHGTGTLVGDPQEMHAIMKVFCAGRSQPLLVGSVKSNMGHSEPVSGLCGLSKMVLSHTKGILPANLHYNTPNPDIPALVDRRIRVVDKNQQFKAKYVGLNSMGFGGTNVHILLKFNNHETAPPWVPSIPVILLCSGRSNQAVTHFLDQALLDSKNQHFVKLLHELSKEAMPRHPFRGYVVIHSESMGINVHNTDPKESVWFIFTGMGSQWVGMFTNLIKFDAFNKSVDLSHNYLENINYNLRHVLKSAEPTILDAFKNAMVTINVFQVALVDLLNSIGIKPDGIIGHSTGEVTAGYADGCLSHEQTVLISHARARSFLESNVPPGTVAAVGLTWEDAHKRCPEGIYPAIHNGKDNVTIAGSPELVNRFVRELQSQGIFAKLIRSALHGYHSPLVYNSKPLAHKLLQKIIPTRTLRSKKWLSSSVQEHLWNEDFVKYSSVEYYVNNGLNTVYFYPTLLHVPANSIALEIAPHCFMLSILKQSLPKSCVTLGLVHVKSSDNCVYFLNSIGQCHLHGLQVNVGELYEPVPFPVSSRTPCISPLIRWDYSDNWYVPHNSEEINNKKGTSYIVNMNDEETSFFKGHSFQGKVIFPATGYLWLVWRYFATKQTCDLNKCPVVFQDLRFERVTFITSLHDTEFLVNMLHGSGIFEVLESNQVVCTGVVRSAEEIVTNGHSDDEAWKDIDTSGPVLCRQDFYKEMHLRGYGHSGQFQGIQQVHIAGKWAQIEWLGHWASFLDSILQTCVLQTHSREMVVPIRMKKLFIDPVKVSSSLQSNNNVITFKTSNVRDNGGCPGFEFQGLSFARLNQRQIDPDPMICEQEFLPYNSTEITDVQRHVWESFIEIARDNSHGETFVYTEVLTNIENTISHIVSEQCLLSFPTIDCTTASESYKKSIDHANVTKTVLKVTPLKNLQPNPNNNLVFIDSITYYSIATTFVKPEGFILCAITSLTDTFMPEFIHISTKIVLDQGIQKSFALCRKHTSNPKHTSIISMDSNDFSWVETSKQILNSSANFQRYIFTSTSSTSGIVGFIKCLVKELSAETIRCFQTIDNIILNFENPTKSLQAQLQNDLVYNIYKNGQWGYLGYQSIKFEKLQTQNYPCAYADVLKMGELSSLSWIASTLSVSKSNLVEVEYSSLNFKDIMYATSRLNKTSEAGRIRNERALGFEFSGTFQGKRVFGLGSSQCLATHINPDNLFLFDMPENWTFEEAATIPAAYTTVYLALIVRGKIKSGESILVHAGSGGVGQAAISVALSMNCKVFTTVSTKQKRDFLKTRFPSLKDENFTNSRNANEFRTHLHTRTNGRGVDLVLNSIAQESLKASIDCLAENGRFLEIGKFDMMNDTNIGLSVLLKGLSIIGIHVEKLLDDIASKETASLRRYINSGIKSGVVLPLNFQVFQSNQLEHAFRLIAQGKHMGKVLIQIKENNNIPASIAAYPRTYFHSNKSYVIVGGLGGMGFELANWMVSRGARNLILVSRTGTKSTYHEYRINIWEKQGVSILISLHDLSAIEGTRQLFKESTKLGPIGGIFNTAVIDKDAPFENQTPATFMDSVNCKAIATLNLDTISRNVISELDHFVVFSSITAGRGFSGQTNYGFSNSVMERICEQRHRDGLPALAVQWGAVGDVGILYRKIGDKVNFKGLTPQRLKSCFDTLDLFLQQKRPIVTSFVAFKQCDSEENSVNDSLVERVARVMGINDASKINPKSTLLDLGMDSIMAAEISQILSTCENVQISAKSHGQITFEILAQLDKGEGKVQQTNPEYTIGQTSKLLKLQKTTTPVFKMKSSANSSLNVFIVHPMDGTMQTLETLIGHLNVNVYGTACVKETPLTSIESIAAFYVEKIQAIQNQGPYILGGYSFGCCVAFEMTLQLERQGNTVPLLLLLDGSPLWNVINESFGGGDDKLLEWENTVLFGFLQQFSRDADLLVFKHLSKISTIEGKWKFMADVLKGETPDMSHEEITSFMMSYMARMECFKNYEVLGKVQSKTVLLKASKSGLSKAVTFDYGLNGICEAPVTIVEVEGDHYCFYEKPLELGIPKIINTFLEKV